MKVRQGDIFWISPNETNEIESDHTHPYVVVQDDTADSVTVCALTTNLRRAKAPGNVLLDEGEANLPRQSVVVVSQVSTVDRSQLGEYIGTLTRQRFQQVAAGIRFLQIMTRHHEQSSEKKGFNP
jgi:mRNA interferase MazF